MKTFVKEIVLLAIAILALLVTMKALGADFS